MRWSLIVRPLYSIDIWCLDHERCCLTLGHLETCSILLGRDQVTQERE